MKVAEKKYSVTKLVKAVLSGSLLRNEEYQRGAAWTELQKAAFIDSIFRSYPVPALFLYEVQSAGLDEQPTVKYEIVDGQQRLLALRDFTAGKFALLEINERSRLRLPRSVRAKPAPWAGRRYSELGDDLRKDFDDAELGVFILGPETSADEVRDLFIRLQSGTALSRQQIRDAWPGNLGPFVEVLAGKLDKRPSQRLFAIIDKRGQRTDDEDQRDQFVADRQICAQLLKVFLAHERDPYAFPSVSANELDAMYHEHTDFDPHGAVAERFKSLLDVTAKVFQYVNALRTGKSKVRRLDVTSTLIFLGDISRNPLTKIDDSSLRQLAQRITESDDAQKPVGKSTSGATLARYYEWWRDNVGQSIGIHLDARRFFDEAQKQEIRRRDGGTCGVCGKVVLEEEAEYDHFPVPHRDGGPTEVANGRLVHKACHERGRPEAPNQRLQRTADTAR
jgi:hypothetical protein